MIIVHQLPRKAVPVHLEGAPTSPNCWP